MYKRQPIARLDGTKIRNKAPKSTRQGRISYLVILHEALEGLSNTERQNFETAEDLIRLYANWLRFHFQQQGQCPFQWITRTPEDDLLPRSLRCFEVSSDTWRTIFNEALTGMASDKLTPVGT